jgi:hypothetical protein
VVVLVSLACETGKGGAATVAHELGLLLVSGLLLMRIMVKCRRSGS